jgi:hypothetical protein
LQEEFVPCVDIGHLSDWQLIIEQQIAEELLAVWNKHHID